MARSGEWYRTMTMYIYGVSRLVRNTLNVRLPASLGHLTEQGGSYGWAPLWNGRCVSESRAVTARSGLRCRAADPRAPALPPGRPVRV